MLQDIDDAVNPCGFTVFRSSGCERWHLFAPRFRSGVDLKNFDAPSSSEARSRRPQPSRCLRSANLKCRCPKGQRRVLRYLPVVGSPHVGNAGASNSLAWHTFEEASSKRRAKKEVAMTVMMFDVSIEDFDESVAEHVALTNAPDVCAKDNENNESTVDLSEVG
jgi:hypothetical protein